MRKVPNPTQNQHRGRERHGFRGVPPPADFSLAALPDDALLTEYQVGAFIQVSTNTIQSWRRQPDHPLEWEVLPNGLIRYCAGAVRAYLALGRRRQPKPEAAAPKPGAAAPKPAAAFERAIALFGSQEKLARAAGVHANTIWKALHSCHASRKLGLAIERATGGEVRADELILEGAQRTPKPEAVDAPKNNNTPNATEQPKPLPKAKRGAAAHDLEAAE